MTSLEALWAKLFEPPTTHKGDVIAALQALQPLPAPFAAKMRLKGSPCALCVIAAQVAAWKAKYDTPERA